MPVVPVKITATPAPQLLFSDRPEYFRSGDGIALQETVQPGVIRLYVYHVPGPNAAPKVITSVIQNCGTNTLQFRFLRYAFPKPGGNYQEIGKHGLIDYFNSPPQDVVRTLVPNARMVIDPAMDETVVNAPQLVHGFYEFEIDQPAKISVLQREPGQKSTEVVERLRLLKPTGAADAFSSGAGRGRFPNCNFEVANQDGAALSLTHGPMLLIIADGKRDPWINGTDSIENNGTATNKGNYGAIYHIRLNYNGSAGKGFALLAYNPLGEGTGCSELAMAVRINKGAFAAGVVPVPAEKISFGGRGQMVLIQRFPPLPGGVGGTLELDYSPPGASCLPTPFMLVPYDQ